MEAKGHIHSIENFATVDGPGVRYVIFLQGCPLRCQFCHNPDTWDTKGGNLETVSEVLDKAERFRSYWREDGGITVSGGEPLMQIEFVIELFKEAKARGINTCLDTSGATFRRNEKYLNKFDELLKYTNLILLDIKQINDKKHKVLTGKTNANILDMATYLSDKNQPVWIRHVLVPKGSDNDEDLHELSKFLDTLNNIKKVEVLPYHTLGLYKYKEMGIEYPLKDIQSPTEERVLNAKKILKVDQYK